VSSVQRLTVLKLMVNYPHNMKSKIYLAIKADAKREVFRSATNPTREQFPQYFACVGPFRTVRGARFMRDFGMNNPHCQCVRDAERLGKKYRT
jgi:hypothetical protein